MQKSLGLPYPRDLFPMTTSPIWHWEEYVAAHPPMAGFDDYPHVDGDRLAVDYYPLWLCHVVGETSLWEKVSA